LEREFLKTLSFFIPESFPFSLVSDFSLYIFWVKMVLFSFFVVFQININIMRAMCVAQGTGHRSRRVYCTRGQ
jgi:hypothetical protein